MNSNKYESYPGKVIHTVRENWRTGIQLVHEIEFMDVAKVYFRFCGGVDRRRDEQEWTSKECCRLLVGLVLVCLYFGSRWYLLNGICERSSVCGAIERTLHGMDILPL